MGPRAQAEGSRVGPAARFLGYQEEKVAGLAEHPFAVQRLSFPNWVSRAALLFCLRTLDWRSPALGCPVLPPVAIPSTMLQLPQLVLPPSWLEASSSSLLGPLNKQ